jgi:hypothetical protein
MPVRPQMADRQFVLLTFFWISELEKEGLVSRTLQSHIVLMQALRVLLKKEDLSQQQLADFLGMERQQSISAI